MASIPEFLAIRHHSKRPWSHWTTWSSWRKLPKRLPEAFDELGYARAAAYHRSKAQAEAMRRRHNLDPNSEDYHYEIGDMVKLKHHAKTKFQFDWKGPYHIVDVGFPGTYWLMDPQGRRFRLDCQ
ncbi:hypothetical protein BASA62_009801 [Batrachochytrium salamandrivorans]|nr:hypothetical protein BASA62_009801 [Batrachochytrium salamandrivorans]